MLGLLGTAAGVLGKSGPLSGLTGGGETSSATQTLTNTVSFEGSTQQPTLSPVLLVGAGLVAGLLLRGVKRGQ